MMYYYMLESPVFAPNQRITISVPVTSRCTAAVRTRARVIIYEGSVLPTHGTRLAEYTSAEATLSPGETREFSVSHTTVKGSIDRRDIGVVVSYWDGSKWVDDGSSEFDDVYYVRENYAFEIGQPLARSA
jgi:hypothetical protein